jgi:hypothetical protein
MGFHRPTTGKTEAVLTKTADPAPSARVPQIQVSGEQSSPDAPCACHPVNDRFPVTLAKHVSRGLPSFWLTNDFDNHIQVHMKRGDESSQGAAAGEGPGKTQSRRAVIARGAFSSVESCGCGAVYLTVGPVCLKIAANALPELLSVLERAAIRLGPSLQQAVSACSGEAMPEDGGGEGESPDDQSN